MCCPQYFSDYVVGTCTGLEMLIMLLSVYLDCLHVTIRMILKKELVKVNRSHYQSEVPREFQEVKIPRLRDNGTGWW